MVSAGLQTLEQKSETDDENPKKAKHYWPPDSLGIAEWMAREKESETDDENPRRATEEPWSFALCRFAMRYHGKAQAPARALP